jgi:hypothetical protein
MNSPNALDPEVLARIAAQLNPKLACEDPAKAIQLARNLVIAADPELAEQEALRAEELQLQEESARHDALFPRGELVSVAEAFKASPGHYKTETRFAAALRKENLIIVVEDVDLPQWQKAWPDQEGKFVGHHEVTSLRAAKELFRRQRMERQGGDRTRKAASKTKNKKNAAEFRGQKAERIRRKAEPENKNRKAQAKKRKPRNAH